jgi:hypothetical protein
MEEQMTEIEDLINNVANQDFSKAGPTFMEIMNAKIDDALEQEKIAVASQIFNGEEPEEDEDEQLEFDLDDVDDEDMDEAIDDLDDEDDD